MYCIILSASQLLRSATSKDLKSLFWIVRKKKVFRTKEEIIKNKPIEKTPSAF